ncbi:Phosphate regulon transcriptional regulatory protein PhoB (SphR) [Leucobacter sp. 7(1)]|uniref:winged helix-turn-helix transcriptional regulator n=1 Tax=Leucobacter sp. 7(1) TaxID=1255613 RepID=UPI00097ECDB2|nr:winged-helix domain-containing protein [Leucobacter sp. 7(1)]SJN13012.1 Phosphate regulon transcriptional regulatory protein PhoB (SphR) [Leucobacter sp. 7(1)]
MELLCLTDRDPAESLPGLDLLPHEIRTSPLSLPVTTTLVARFDALLIDGTLDARRARAACLNLSGGSDTPRVVILPELALTALTPEWGIAEFILPTASPAEIEVRLRLLEQPVSPAPPAAVHSAGVVIDESNFTARLFGRPLDLTYKEFELLHFLAANPARVFTRDQLLSEVWGTDYFGGTRTVDVHVRRLRAKLGDHEALISTVRGVGYGFARARSTDDSEESIA